MTRLNDEVKRWEQDTLAPFSERAPERAPEFRSTCGCDIDRLGLPVADELSEQGTQTYLARLGLPGEYPFARGVTPTMYRGRLWTMRQYAGFRTAEQTNLRYRYLLDSGQTGLSVAFDLPTQMGYDSDHPLAEGEVGKVGVPLDTMEDMRLLFRSIPLDRVTTSMTINAPAAVLLGFYLVMAEEQGTAWEALGGTIQNDILKEYMARGTYIFAPEPSLALTVDTFRFCSENLPRWNMISISGYHLREAGCTAVQEIAFTLADGIEYCQQAVRAGLDIDGFASRLSFFFNAHNNFLEEIAKFRAARRLWARIMRERFGAKNPRSMLMRFHTQTAGSMLTAQQPLNNVVRVTLQALAAVLGGTQSLHTNSYDEAFNLPTEESVTVALRTQQIIAEESGVAETIDPLGGSYFIEQLTNTLEAKAEEHIGEIDQMGGMQKAIEKGFPQLEIHQKAYEWQQQVDRGERAIVGVNKYASEHQHIPAQHHDEAAEIAQRERLEAYKNARGRFVSGYTEQGRLRALDLLTRACETRELICECILDGVRTGSTEGEIVSAMEKVWGRYHSD
ncbi:MAG: methylmalonyl-CoA mutase [Candidatus Riflebacteria bacterium RBG_13_59_9]|nr:MAG: methylmalonyl-CoA mutase [Candidatus Riflebacteria bacterium RBG_13_59_9]